MKSPIDIAIQCTFPVEAYPKSGWCEPPGKPGIRFFLGADGIWEETSLPWLRTLRRISKADYLLPYGQPVEAFDLYCGSIPGNVMDAFRADARKCFPNEMAAALIWNQHSGIWRYALREPLFASRADVEYAEVVPEEGEFLVVDLHSHGAFDAFFSKKDDADDHGSLKFSGVIGNVDRGEDASFCLRLNLRHVTYPAKLFESGELEINP